MIKTLNHGLMQVSNAIFMLHVAVKRDTSKNKSSIVWNPLVYLGYCSINSKNILQ